MTSGMCRRLARARCACGEVAAAPSYWRQQWGKQVPDWPVWLARFSAELSGTLVALQLHTRRRTAGAMSALLTLLAVPLCLQDTLIYSALCPKLGGRRVAVKVYDKKKVQATKYRAIKREIAMMMFFMRKRCGEAGWRAAAGQPMGVGQGWAGWDLRQLGAGCQAWEVGSRW